MDTDIVFNQFNNLKELTKKRLVKIASQNNRVIDSSNGLSYGTLIGKALDDISRNDENSYILPMLTNEFDSSKPFTSAVIIPCSEESTALGCLINCNHEFQTVEQEVNDFAITLINLGSLLINYAGKNLISKGVAGIEMPM